MHERSDATVRNLEKKHWKLWNFLTNLFTFAVRGDRPWKNGAQKTPWFQPVVPSGPKTPMGTTSRSKSLKKKIYIYIYPKHNDMAKNWQNCMMLDESSLTFRDLRINWSTFKKSKPFDERLAPTVEFWCALGGWVKWGIPCDHLLRPTSTFHRESPF